MKFTSAIFFITLISLHSFSQSGQWAWMKGDSTFHANPIWGTKGVDDPANNPPRKYSFYHWQDSSGNFWIYSGVSKQDYGNEGYNDLWKFDLQTQNWTWMQGDSILDQPPVYGTQGIPSAANTPGYRYFSGLCWTDNSGKFWLYSGMGNGADMWMYDPAINEWTWMQGTQVNTSPTYGTYQVSSPLNTPGTNAEDNASWVDNQNNLWFYGGQSESNSALWKYDTGTNEWTWMSGSNTYNANPVYGTLGVPSTTNTPGGRWCYASWKDDDGNFMLFGGRKEINMIGAHERNDLWKYNLTDETWTWMGGDSTYDQSGNRGDKCEFSDTFIPGARFENRACAKDTCGNIWMYGGYTSPSNTYSDLWLYRSQQNDWAWQGDTVLKTQYGTKGVADSANTPGERFGTMIWFDHDGIMWLFGGQGWGLMASETEPKQDLWNYIPSCISTSCLATQVNNEIAAQDLINVYPNPSSGIFTLEISASGNLSIEIRNVIGQIVYSSEEKNIDGNFKKQIDLTGQSSGIYFLTVKNDEQQWVEKIVIE